MPNRFRLVELSGYGGAGKSGTLQPAISFSILDRFVCHQEVWHDYAGTTRMPIVWRRERAQRVCRELNKDERLSELVSV